MKVLFIGGTGLISTACTHLAIERGVDLYLLNRGQRQADIPPQARVINADIRHPDQAAAALRGQTFDCVVNFICFTPQQVEADIHLFAGKIGHYIFISSASAYQKPVTNYLITESTPLANPHWEYSRQKIAAEERVIREYRDKNFPGTIVRPSLTYGPTMIPQAMGSWAHPWTNVDRILRGKPILVHGDGTSLWVTTHNTDFAKGLHGLLANHQTIGHVFHITSDEVLNWNQIYQTVGRAVGVEPKLAHVASEFIIKHRPEEEGSLLGDKSHSVVFDNSKLKRFVPGFVATTSLAEGTKMSIDWFSAHPDRQKVDAEANHWIDGVIAAHARGMT
jgi:nucleoside-diphosphate-sugar epimerase